MTPPSKTIQAKALDLLSLWQRRRAEGGEVDVLALCGGDAALAAEVERGVAAVAMLDFAVAGLTPTIRNDPDSVGTDWLRTEELDRAPAPTPDLPFVPGYELLGVLGRGGMGVVYQARQASLGRIVALKMIAPHAPLDAEELQRFRAEAEAVARLQHPNIVQIFEIGDVDGRPFFTLEYVAGGTLQQRIQAQPQPPKEAAALVADLARAVQACHDQGIIHRDLKPGNVLLGLRQEALAKSQDLKRSLNSSDASCQMPFTSLIPKLTDFGLARRHDSELTKSGSILGTPSYMAPEQAAGSLKEIGPACDQYALGAILYHLLTGRPPFLGATAYETVDLVLRSEPAPPRRLVPAVPRDLETIALKALRKKPADRYPSAAAFADDLDRCLRNEPIVARPAGLLERAVRWAQRNRSVAALLAAVAVLIVGSIASLTWFLVRVSEESAAKSKAITALQAEQRQTASTLWHVVFDLNRGLEGLAGAEELRAKLLNQALGRALKADPEAQNLEGVHHSQVGAHNDLGDMLRLSGRTAEALKHYAAALEHAEGLLKQKPDDEHYREEIMVSGTKLMDMKLAQGALAEPLAHYRQTLAGFTEGDAAPRKRKHQRSLILNRLAVAALDAGLLDEAEATAKEELALAEKVPFPPLVVLAHRHLGDVIMKRGKEPKEFSEARRRFEAMAEAARAYAAQQKGLEARNLLGEALSRCGDAAVKEGKPEEAEQLQRQALAVLRPQASAPQLTPASTAPAAAQALDPQRDLIPTAVLEKLAALALARGQAEAASALLKQAEPARRQLAADAAHLQRQMELARHLRQKAAALDAHGDTAGAAQARREAAANWARLEAEGRLQERPWLQEEAKSAK